MKKIIAFVFLIAFPFTAVENLFAECDDGFAQNIDMGNIYITVKDSCPAGYAEVVSNRNWVPFKGICDASKGTCSDAGICLVP